jgi:hypothetical protein
MVARLLLSAFCALLVSCSVGIVSVGDNDFYCHNIGKTKCKFSVTQYSEGMPTETVDVEVSGGNMSDTLSELLQKVALAFGGAKL